jgi:hypothetical protein
MRVIYTIRLSCGHIRECFSKSGTGFYCSVCETKDRHVIEVIEKHPAIK